MAGFAGPRALAIGDSQIQGTITWKLAEPTNVLMNHIETQNGPMRQRRQIHGNFAVDAVTRIHIVWKVAAHVIEG